MNKPENAEALDEFLRVDRAAKKSAEEKIRETSLKRHYQRSAATDQRRFNTKKGASKSEDVERQVDNLQDDFRKLSVDSEKLDSIFDDNASEGIFVNELQYTFRPSEQRQQDQEDRELQELRELREQELIELQLRDQQIREQQLIDQQQFGDQQEQEQDFLPYSSGDTLSNQGSISETDSDSDSNCDIMAAAAGILPFRGLSTDPEGKHWLKKVEMWMNCQRLRSDKAKICQVGVLLKGNAAFWFNELVIEDPVGDGEERAISEEAVTTWEQFKELFLEKFKKVDGDNWREVTDLFQCKQREDQSTEEYIAEIQMKGLAANATPENIRYAAISGLKRSVKNVVVQHPIESLDQIIKWGMIAERLEPAKPNEGDVSKLVKIAVLDALAESKQDQSAAVFMQSDQRVDRNQGVDDQAERRVYRQQGGFNRRKNGRGRGNTSSWRQDQGGSDGWRPGISMDNQAQGRPMGRGRGNWSREGQGDNWRMSNQQSSGVQSYYSPRQFTNNNTFGNFDNGFDNNGANYQCDRCGSTRPHGIRGCPALASSCAFCKKIGHWKAVCRGRAQQSPWRSQ